MGAARRWGVMSEASWRERWVRSHRVDVSRSKGVVCVGGEEREREQIDGEQKDVNGKEQR